MWTTFGLLFKVLGQKMTHESGHTGITQKNRKSKYLQAPKLAKFDICEIFLKNVKMSSLVLPPRLTGNTRATLELKIEAILLTNFSAKKRIGKSSVKVFVRWWGQSLSDGIYFSPRIVQSLGLRRDSSPATRGIRVAIFKV